MDRRNGGCVAVNYYDFAKIGTFLEALNPDVKELERRKLLENWSSLVEQWSKEEEVRERGVERVRSMGEYSGKNRFEDALRKVIEVYCEDLKECEEDEVQRAKEEEEYFNVYVAEDEERDLSVASKLLESVTKELKEVKEELASVKEEVLKLMSSMKVIRNELAHVAEEKARMKETEEVANPVAGSLNLKLARAKLKLESAAAVEEKAKGIVAQLMHALELWKTKAEAAKKENEGVSEEILATRMEIEKTEGEIDFAEERLKAAVAELELVRVSEDAALRHLKTLVEKVSQERASAYQNRTHITISKYEYDYLKEEQQLAEEVADKKVAAAMAWVEALGSSKREILMKLKMGRRDVWEMRIEEEQHVYSMERLLSAKRCAEAELMYLMYPRSHSRKAEAKLSNCRLCSRRVEGEPKSRRSLSVKRQVKYESKNRRPEPEKKAEADNMQSAWPIESTKKARENGSSYPAESFRESSTLPMNRCPSLTRSTSFKLQKKKKKLIPNLFKILNRAARTKSEAF